MRDITIKPALNGYICKVGCQVVVFEDAERMTTALFEYLKRPHEVEAQYIRNALNPMEERPPEQVPTAPGRVTFEPGLPAPANPAPCVCEQAAQQPAPPTAVPLRGSVGSPREL